MNTSQIFELFDGGWLPLGEDLPPVRVIVARHQTPETGKQVTVGKRIGERIYEIFITTLSADCFLVKDVLDLYHGRGAFEAVLSDEGVEEDPDRWCSHTECGQELWQAACQWVWNLRLSLGQMMQGSKGREIEWAPPKEATLFFMTAENPPEEYGPWQWAAPYAGRFGGDAFVLQENGTLRCPAKASLWLREVYQENAFTQRATYVAFRTDCQCCSLREQCLASPDPDVVFRTDFVAGSVGASRESVVHRLWPGNLWDAPSLHARRWSTGPSGALWPHVDGSCWQSASRLRGAGSSRWRPSPILPRATFSLTW